MRSRSRGSRVGVARATVVAGMLLITAGACGEAAEVETIGPLELNLTDCGMDGGGWVYAGGSARNTTDRGVEATLYFDFFDTATGVGMVTSFGGTDGGVGELDALEPGEALQWMVRIRMGTGGCPDCYCRLYTVTVADATGTSSYDADVALRLERT